MFTRAHLYTVAGAVRPAGGVAYFVRDGALHSPNPLCAPRSQTPASRLFGSTEPEISPPKGGATHRFLPYLVICDIGLPDGNGLDLCASIRQKSDVLFLFLTALDTEVDMITGYEMGADDYVTKPFSMSVLISKISAMLKRTEKTISNVVQTGELTFYINEKRVTKGNDIISITPTDWKLLMAFIEHPRHILSRNQLLESLWDVNSDYVDENAVAVNIRRLREKIEPDPSNPVYIKNVRGLGYVWEMRCERQ